MRDVRGIRPLAALGVALIASTVALSCSAEPARGSGVAPVPTYRPARDVPLVWYVESADDAAADLHGESEPINPASVVKAATTLWALERLGPDHRFETGFGVRGRFDPVDGVLYGDLIVRGGGDPDFHVENGYLVAEALNRAGLREVRGSLRVDGRFWIGWEGGSERRTRDPVQRASTMAARLREALDPSRWSAATRRSLEAFVARRGLDGSPPPSVVVRGTAGYLSDPLVDRELVVHRSNPLKLTLKRFNSFSNNDIERLELALGSADELARFLTDRWAVAPDALQLATLSGLGSNRMTSRQVVHLLADLRRTCAAAGLDVRDVLPAAGCDPGTLESFRRITESGAELVAKTGTLTTTDGGVVVLAGFVGTVRGELVFCVVAPQSGRATSRARAEQQRWLLDLIARHDGGASGRCGAPLGFSDDRAEALVVR